MLLKQLEYFVCVVDNNSFTQAATEQYVSQSAISQQIKALETSLGVELMVREKRSFHLTPAGQYLYRSGKKLLERFHAIKVETTRIGTDARVSLRIGYLNRYSGMAMQQTVIRMAKRYKNLDIRMYSGSHEELYGMLDDRRVDVIFNDQWQILSDDYESYLIDKEEHYRKAIGYAGAFAYARTLEEARYLVAGQQGLLLLDRFKYLTDSMPGIERKVLTNHGKSMERNYYFVSQQNQNNTYVEAFREMFKQVLAEF